MARIYLSPLIVDIRNKQSDTVFSKWKGINYIRSRVIPHNPKTAAQIAIREAFARLVSLWQDAYPSVKINWDDWASGRDYSGFNKFVGKNTIKERDGTVIDLMQEVGFTKLLTLNVTTGSGAKEIDIAWTPTPVPANTDLEVHIRETGESLWAHKVTYAAAVTSPQTVAMPDGDTVYRVFAYLVKDTAPSVEETGDDLNDSVTSNS